MGDQSTNAQGVPAIVTLAALMADGVDRATNSPESSLRAEKVILDKRVTLGWTHGRPLMPDACCFS